MMRPTTWEASGSWCDGGRRFREVDLGDVDPFGEGSAADQYVAGIGLSPGDDMKYVYDFGGCIEHRLTLEEIVTPEVGVAYLRVVSRNKPRYRYCPPCKGQRRRSLVNWLCLDCSDAQQRDVLLCEACLTAEHEDHEAAEVVC